MGEYIEYKSGQYSATDNRPSGFDNNVYNVLGAAPRENMEVCHGISFHTIKEGIVNGLNYFLNNDFTKGALVLGGVIAAVLRLKIIYTEDADELKNELLAELPGGYRNFIQNVTREFTDPFGFDIEEAADSILKNLFNETPNLRWGNSSWNRSIEAAFDPSGFGWKQGDVYLSVQDSIAVNDLLWFAPDVAVWFYTFKYNSKQGISSSDNTYNIPENCEDDDSVTIYYKNYVYNEWRKIC